MSTDYAIKNGRTVMDAVTYTGTGSANTAITGTGFKPDFVWAKSRSNAQYNGLFDSNRSGYALYSNASDVEDTTEQITFNSNGFSTPNKSADFINTNGNTYVSWQWQAGQGTTSSNTSGSITSTVSVNAAAGFSVVTYTGNGSSPATIGHGLGATPKFVIFKCRSNNESWNVYSSVIAPSNLRLNTTAAGYNEGNYNTFTSSVLSVNGNDPVNHSGWTYVAYCWTPIAGYSSFGSYTGNGSSNGPFVYLGFRAKFLMIKRTDSAGYSWFLVDTTRNPSNVANLDLYANATDVEAASNNIDILSNGFKPTDSSTGTNGSGGTFMYVAFAENPFKYANAR